MIEQHVTLRDGIYIAVPSTLTHQQDRSRYLRFMWLRQPHIATQVEVEDYLDIGAEDAEMMPLFVAVSLSVGESREAEVVGKCNQASQFIRGQILMVH